LIGINMVKMTKFLAYLISSLYILHNWAIS